jgi:hypothetical protein
VTLSTSTPVDVEVWNATNSDLIARQTVSSTDGRAIVVIPFDYARSVPVPGSFSGIGPFIAQRQPPPSPLDQLEIRVWTPRGGHTNVYTVGLAPTRH